jgi:pyridoxine 4-dehydrogenase
MYSTETGENHMTNKTTLSTIKIGEFNVNRLGFGAMRITGEGIWGMPVDIENAKAVLRRAVELGVDFFDTADAYGPEVSEQLIHDALYPYDNIIIATKGGLTRQGPGIWTPDCSPEHLREALEASLKRLDVKAIDIYQLHTIEPNVAMESSLQTLIDLKAEGKIKHIGLSNVSLEQLTAAREMTEIASVQNMYNITSTESEKVLQYCADHEIAFIPYFPIGGDGSTDLTVMQEIADKYEATVHQIALAWLLQHSPATLPIPGTSSLKHLEENVASRDIELTDEDMTELDGLAG